MKENRGKEERRQRCENQGARRIVCPSDTMLAIKPSLAALDLNTPLQCMVIGFWHDLESRDMKSTHRIHAKHVNDRLTKHSFT
jgi:hypothetical protein